MWTWGGLTQSNFTRCEDDLMLYVRGSYPLHLDRAWPTVEMLYGFGHVIEDHWVDFEVSFRDQRITVVDSMFLGSKRIGQHFAHMSRQLPLLCEKVNLWEKKGYSEPMRNIWEVVYAADSPRQQVHDKHNCSILVMKALEAMMRRDPFDTVKPDHCSVYRLRYCVDLHAHSQLIPADE